MKPEYKEKVLSHLEGINVRSKTVREMVEGKRPSNQRDAIKLINEVERLSEFIQNLVEVS